MRARLIAIEGIDQSGKRTQTQLLSKRLRAEGFEAKTIRYPIYRSSSGRLIRAFLNGKRDYPPQAIHMLYSLNRWENLEVLKNHLEHSNFVIADRYAPSNLAYGVSKGLDLRWLQDLDNGLPEPDLVLVLDVPVPAAFTRKAKGRDVHERNRRFMLKVKENYSSLAPRLGWKLVRGNMPSDRVHHYLWNEVRARFGSTLNRQRKLG